MKSLWTPPDFRVVGAEDCSKYFSETCVYAKIGVRPNFEWIFVLKVLNNGNNVPVFCIKDSEWISFNLDSSELWIDQEVWSKIPNKSFNWKNSVIFLRRLPNRQWKKGLCSENLRMVPLAYYVEEYLRPDIREDFRHYFQSAPPFGSSSLISLLSQKINPFDGVNDVLKGNCLARSLGGNFSISAGVFSKLPTIWYKTFPIGEAIVNPTRIMEMEIQSVADDFYQEAYDYFGEKLGVLVRR